jgi:hypothetical protein
MMADCRVCGEKNIRGIGAGVCMACARKAAEYVLSASHPAIAVFWNVNSSMLERRKIALELSKKRKHVKGAAEIGAGLATGYLEQGLLTDALIVASISLRLGPTAEDFCWCAIDVLFDGRLLKQGRLVELNHCLNGSD